VVSNPSPVMKWETRAHTVRWAAEWGVVPWTLRTFPADASVPQGKPRVSVALVNETILPSDLSAWVEMKRGQGWVLLIRRDRLPMMR
jgi:hypothetical protein